MKRCRRDCDESIKVTSIYNKTKGLKFTILKGDQSRENLKSEVNVSARDVFTMILENKRSVLSDNFLFFFFFGCKCCLALFGIISCCCFCY